MKKGMGVPEGSGGGDGVGEYGGRAGRVPVFVFER